MWKNKFGFSLVELLVVISIIGVLAASTIAISVKTNVSRGHDNKRKADLEAIRSAVEIYRSENGKYPISCGWVSYVYNGLYGNISLKEQGLEPSYITILPIDPLAPIGSHTGPNNQGYMYSSNGCGNSGLYYGLWAKMEIATNGNAAQWGAMGGETRWDTGYGMNYKVLNP